MAGNKNKLFLAAALDQLFLQIDAVQTRHSHIDNQAGMSGMRRACEKIESRLERFAFVSGGPQEPRHAFSHGRIVVNQEYQAFPGIISKRQRLPKD